MAGINADADAGFIFHAVDNRCEMFKFKPCYCLTGGVFNHRGDTLSFIQRNVDGFGNTRKAIPLLKSASDGCQGGSEQRKPQLFATLHFIYKRHRAIFPELQQPDVRVNQITVVGRICADV